MLRKHFALAIMIAGAGVAAYLAGCNKSAPVASAAAASQVSNEVPSDHGWWCDEHGVPEEVCTRCDPKLVADFKAKGDWCSQHECPDSQCFICHPEREGEFAALYEAKYGKQPPKPELGLK
jgi:cobalt-zinc-cadmium efflux system membrane fusion protein